jgi:hypothetical protein
MRHLTRIALLLILITSFTSSASAQYGHVGSDEWFAQMRKSAANQAMLKALMRKHGGQQLPADYIEFAGRIVFPEGNPFPKQRIPDLRIKCRDSQADDVERAPFVDDEGGFYTVFKRGQSYDLYWMYAFGSREKFASIFIKPDGPARRKHVFEYRPHASDNRGSEVDWPAIPTRAPQQAAAPPVDVDTFDLSGFPPQPTNFEEQQVMEEIKYATTAALKALAHERLARYYEKRGDQRRAKAEYAKAAYWRSQ